MAGYFGQTYELRFENEPWLDITNYIDSRQTKVTDIGCTEELKGGISTCKVELRYGDKKNKPLKQHSKIVGKLLTAKANNELVQFRMSGQVNFVGKIDLGNFSQTNSRIPGFVTLDCEDNSYLLNEMMESFEYPDNSDLADVGYTIFDENNKSTSIVVQRLLASGYALSDIDFNASDNITELVRRIAYAEDENTTYRDFLNTLLFEHCAILYMRGDGKFVVKRLYKSNPVATRDVDFAQKNGITTQAGNYQSDGEVVAWSTLSLDTERNIYVSNISLSRDDDGNLVGEEIQPNHYWPPDGDIEETWQEYNANFLDRPYTTKESRLRNKDISIISAKNVQAEIIKDNEMIIANNPPEIEPKRARFLFYNNDSVNVKKMYAFALKGDVLYRSKRNESTYPVGSRIPNDPYESTYLYNSDGATRLVNHLYRFRKYGDIKHRWVEFRDIPNVFDIVTVSAPDTHISTLAMVLSRNITIVTPDTIKAEIGAVSITPFNSEPPKTRSVALGRLPVEPGLDGAPGPKVVIQYALGTEEAPYSDKGNLLGTDSTLVGTDISLVGVEGGGVWTDSVPTPSEGEYVWRREGQYTPPAVWPKVWEVTRLTGEGYTGIELSANPKDIIVTKRGLVRTPTIRISAAIRGTQGDIEWSLSDGDFDEVDEFTIDIDATTVLGNETIITAETDKYKKELTINKIIVDTDTPINFGMIDQVNNIPKVTEDGDFLIEGDYFLWGGGAVTVADLALAGYEFLSDLAKGEIYEYGGSSWDISKNGNLVLTLFDSLADLENDYDTSVLGYAVIKKLVSIDAFIKNLVTQNLRVGYEGATEHIFDYADFNGSRYAITDSYPITGVNRTFEMWIKPDKISAYEGLLIQSTGADNTSSVNITGFQCNNGGISLAVGDGSDYYISPVISISTGIWTHVAGIIKGGDEIEIYINGNLFGKDSLPINPPTGSLKVVLGRIGEKYLTGKMRDLRIWNTARTEQQIKDNMLVTLAGDELGLVSLWLADEKSGTTFAEKVEGTDAVANSMSWGQENTLIGGGSFKFRAMSDGLGDGTNEPIFDIMYGDNRIFSVNPIDGKIFFGKHFWYDPSDEAIHSKDDKTIIRADGKIEVSDGDFKGHIIAESGYFKGIFNTTALYLAPGDVSSIDVTLPSNISQTVVMINTMRTNGLESGIFYKTSVNLSTINMKYLIAGDWVEFTWPSDAIGDIAYLVWLEGSPNSRINFLDKNFQLIRRGIRDLFISTNSQFFSEVVTFTIHHGLDKLKISENFPVQYAQVEDYQIYLDGDTLKVRLP